MQLLLWYSLLPYAMLHAYASQIQYTLFVTTAWIAKKIVLPSNFPFSEGPVQSESINWVPTALSLHQDCPYIKCSYKESVL